MAETLCQLRSRLGLTAYKTAVTCTFRSEYILARIRQKWPKNMCSRTEDLRMSEYLFQKVSRVSWLEQYRKIHNLMENSIKKLISFLCLAFEIQYTWNWMWNIKLLLIYHNFGSFQMVILVFNIVGTKFHIPRHIAYLGTHFKCIFSSNVLVVQAMKAEQIELILRHHPSLWDGWMRHHREH